MSVKIEDCDVLIRPILNEKSVAISAFGQFVFEVNKRAKKNSVKKAVEALFDVKVKYVNMLRRKGKPKVFKGVAGQRREVKRAIVCLESGYNIDLTGL